MKSAILLLILLPFFLRAQSQKEIDSLIYVIKIEKSDTTKVKLLNTLSKVYLHTGSYDQARATSEDCIKFIDKILDQKKQLASRETEVFNIGKAESYGVEGFSYSGQGDYKNGKLYLLRALKVFFDSHNKLGMTRAYNNLGTVEFENGNFSESIKYHLNSLKINNELGNEKGKASNYNNLANVYVTIKKFSEAKKMFREAITIYSKTNRKQGIANAYNNLGLLYDDEALYDSASYYLNKSLKIRLEMDDKQGVAGSYGNIAGVYYKLNNLKEAIAYYNKSLVIKEEIGDLSGVGSQYIELAGIYSEINDQKKAIELMEKGLKTFEKTDAFDDLKIAYETCSKIYSKIGDYKKAYEFHVKFFEINDSLFNEKNSKIIHELSTRYETEKKEKENKLLQTENKLSTATIKQQKLISYFIVVGLIIVSFLAFFIFNGLKKQRRANVIISEQKKEVESQKQLIEEHQKETIDSINYAKRIQYALLANNEILKRNIPEHFIFFNPKDIVSGDFYWATEHENRFYLAVCDSTGHGVPGAFMSLLNIGFLSEAIKEKNIVLPNEVLNYVRKRLIESIGSDGQQDGMDAILICINKNDRSISYAAANNEPILIRENKIIELPKDKMPVGKGEKTNDFSLFTIEANKGDVLYLYTDGFADQFGGDKGKKFKYKRLNDLLAAHSTKEMNKQTELLVKEFKEWKGDLEQVDDVCVIGIRI